MQKISVLMGLTPAAWQALREMAEQNVIERAAEVGKLDARQNPESHPRARAAFLAAVELLAEVPADVAATAADGGPLWPPLRGPLDHTGRSPAALYDGQGGPSVDTVNGLPHTWAEQQAALREGIDPIKELGPMDPRAFNPRCVHGKRFTENCEHCDKFATAEASRWLKDSGPGFDANGSPVT